MCVEHFEVCTFKKQIQVYVVWLLVHMRAGSTDHVSQCSINLCVFLLYHLKTIFRN